jgi:5-hydroxyisourate hydrolase
MTGITTHVLDLSTGRPAEGVGVTLECEDGAGGWRIIGSAVTDQEGRVRAFPTATTPDGGLCRLRFETGAYFARWNQACFHPHVEITFRVEGGSHLHVPLLLSPFGYSTYRGS